MDPLQHFEEQSNLLKIRISSLTSNFLQTKDNYCRILELIQHISVYKEEVQDSYTDPAFIQNVVDTLHDLLDVLSHFTEDISSIKSLLSKEVYFEPRSN